MKLKSSMALIAMGVGGTLLYQNVLNGNVKNMMKKMIKIDVNAINKLEDMM